MADFISYLFFEMLEGIIMVDFVFYPDRRRVAIHRIEIFIYYVTVFKKQ